MSREKQTYNSCDDCQYSYSKNGQESRMCKICELEYFKNRVLDYIEQRKDTVERMTVKGYRKQKEGNWKFVTKMSEPIYWECSACGYKTFDIKGDTNFCPNCGAKMKGGAE